MSCKALIDSFQSKRIHIIYVLSISKKGIERASPVVYLFCDFEKEMNRNCIRFKDEMQTVTQKKTHIIDRRKNNLTCFEFSIGHLQTKKRVFIVEKVKLSK